MGQLDQRAEPHRDPAVGPRLHLRAVAVHKLNVKANFETRIAHFRFKSLNQALSSSG
jgi:hypothetical protein